MSQKQRFIFWSAKNVRHIHLKSFHKTWRTLSGISRTWKLRHDLRLALNFHAKNTSNTMQYWHYFVKNCASLRSLKNEKFCCLVAIGIQHPALSKVRILLETHRASLPNSLWKFLENIAYSNFHAKKILLFYKFYKFRLMFFKFCENFSNECVIHFWQTRK